MNLDDYKKLGENLSSIRSCKGNSTCVSIYPEFTRLDDATKSWNTLDSLHSRDSTADESKSWNTLDSIHSTSKSGDVKFIMETGNSCHDLEDSGSSFASFGDSASEIFGDPMSDAAIRAMADLTIQSRQFRTLSENVTTPRSIYMRQQDLRMKRSSMCNASLTLIDEGTSLD